MGVIHLVVAFAFTALGKTGAEYDAKAQVLRARGAAAADVRSPNADIARTRAEREARRRAEEKLRRGLESLGYGKASELVAGAGAEPEYGSDGSVAVTLTLEKVGTKPKSKADARTRARTKSATGSQAQTESQTESQTEPATETETATQAGTKGRKP